MSRMRQIPVMDIAQREKALYRTLHVPPVRTAPPAVCAKTKKPAAVKFRLADAPVLLSTGCNSVREFCNNVQHITTDLNQLITSVENMLPLLTAYVSAWQMRGISNIPSEPLPAACTEHTISQHAEPNLYRTAADNTAQTESAAPVQSAPVPSSEDLQQLMNNPLVQNLMQSFMQNNRK